MNRVRKPATSIKESETPQTGVGSATATGTTTPTLSRYSNSGANAPGER
jgi:hypothetical protein